MVPGRPTAKGRFDSGKPAPESDPTRAEHGPVGKTARFVSGRRAAIHFVSWPFELGTDRPATDQFYGLSK